MHIVIHDENRNIRGNDFPESLGEIVIGSSPDCQVYLPDIRVADQHLRLVRNSQNVWSIEKCEVPPESSAVHTRIYVNSLDLQENHVVKHHDEVMISRFRLTIFLETHTANSPKTQLMEDAAKIRAHPLPPASIVRTDPFAQAALRPGAVRQITDFAFMIHECVDLSSFMGACVTQVIKIFKAYRVWLGARRKGYGRLDYVESKRSDGGSCNEPPLFETFLFRCAERGQLICCTQTPEPETESAMCVPLVADRGILGMLYVDNKADAAPYGPEDLDLLMAVAAIVAKQLELIVVDLIKHTEAVAAGELSFMRELQSKMDPTNVPQWEGLQLAVYCKPGLEGAGDIYDVMGLPNGLAAFFAGHVKGEATRAALAMAEVRAAFRMGGLHADPPHVLLRAANWLIYNDKARCNMAAVGVVMNPRTGAMQYATAGPMGAVIIDGRGSARSLVQPASPHIGSQKEFAYSSVTGRLDDGETMVLFSPGCYTVTDRDGSELGEERFLDTISDSFGLSASAALDELLSDLKAYFKQGRAKDDISIMVLHRE